MGRKCKYNTNEEKRQANRDKFMRHYWKNAEKIRKKNLKRYYEKKHTKTDN
jgi:hypothetical protein